MRKPELLVKKNLEWLIQQGKTNPHELGQKAGVAQPTIHRILTGESADPRTKTLQPLADYFHVSVADLRDKDMSNMLIMDADLHRKVDLFRVSSAADVEEPVGLIEYWDARGSCGGGASNHEARLKGHLVKEESFFQKYNLRPENAFAIYADGDSMADFIVDGDIVIFNKLKTEPQSGKIFAIEHPDGLRIKALRRAIDGSWILESRNADKRKFPDEIIPSDHSELLKIRGEFVYRQGGYQ